MSQASYCWQNIRRYRTNYVTPTSGSTTVSLESRVILLPWNLLIGEFGLEHLFRLMGELILQFQLQLIRKYCVDYGLHRELDRELQLRIGVDNFAL
jgi:hypothetical protein